MKKRTLENAEKDYRMATKEFEDLLDWLKENHLSIYREYIDFQLSELGFPKKEKKHVDHILQNKFRWEYEGTGQGKSYQCLSNCIEDAYKTSKNASKETILIGTLGPNKIILTKYQNGEELVV